MDAWIKNAKRLADWTWTNLVNRTDVWGAYTALNDREKLKTWTAPAVKVRGRIRLTPAKVESHYLATAPEHVIGLHTTAMDNTCRWIVLEIDKHDDKADAAKNEAAAVWYYNLIKTRGLNVLLTDSNGDGGFHLRVVFSSPMPSAAAYYYLRELTEMYVVAGLPVRPEQFPKQSSLAEDQKGNWVRLPGRHHTREQWARVWSGNGWLEGEQAVEHLLAIPLNAPPEVTTPAPSLPVIGLDEVLDDGEKLSLAQQCIAAIPNPEGLHYDDWLKVGMALHNVSDGGEDGLALWLAWSGLNPKHTEATCRAKWPSFGKTSGDKVGVSSLLRMASAAGAEIQIPKKELATAWQIQPPEGTTILPMPSDVRADPAPLVFDPTKPLPKFANVEDYSRQAGNREIKGARHVPLYLVARSLRSTLGGWPAVSGGQMFIANHSDESLYSSRSVEWIKNPHHLFAWISHHTRPRWEQGEVDGVEDGSIQNANSKQEFYEYLIHHCPQYDSIEVLPHEPKVKGLYYLPCAMPEVDPLDPDTPLKQLVGWLNPETDLDRWLLFSAMMTPGWGGRSGARPAFIFSSDHGRGVGKTQTAQALAYLWGGYVGIKSDEDITEFCARLLDADSFGKRIILLDNLKGRKSDANIEALLTSDVINGKKMYVGARFIPNRFTWYITSNTPSLSSDLAARSVVIRMGKQKHGGADFLSRAMGLIDEHRPLILSELFQYMRREKHPPIGFPDRWGDWQRDVLGVFPDPEAMAKMIVERRPTVDSDLVEAEDIASVIRRYISSQSYNPDASKVFISRRQMNLLLIYEDMFPEKFNPRGICTTIRDRMNSAPLTCLKEHKDADGVRGWLWMGLDADPLGVMFKLSDPVKDPV